MSGGERRGRANPPTTATTVLWPVIVAALVIATATAEQSDFDFGDQDISPIDIPDVGGATYIDDEDYQAQEPGSGPDFVGSGSIENPGGETPEYWRVTVNFTTIEYHEQLGHRTSGAFKELSRELSQAIEAEYADIPGQQVVTILQFRLDSDARPGALDSRDPSVLVTFDLGTVEFYNKLRLFNTLNNAVNRGRIGRHGVSASGFTFRPLTGHETPTPAPSEGCDPYEEFTCVRDGACIQISRRCDGVPDCRDSSDEFECKAECGEEEFQCHSTGECIAHSLRCNREYNCRDGSDELDCSSGPQECDRHQYQCPVEKNCIPISQICDNRPDCSRGEDEINCGTNVCSEEEEFQCRDSGLCIDIRRKCDGTPDCEDSSDESPADCAPLTCSSHQMTCHNGRCVDEWNKCDGVDDCGDKSDEEHCGERGCRGDDEFQCGDGSCIPGSQRCDRQYQCRDYSDERDCPSVPQACDDGEFQCSNGNCISGALRCDGKTDCADTTDEQGCRERTCPSGHFMCLSGHCLQDHRVCDGRPDCPDASDEQDCTSAATCRPDQWQCQDGACISAQERCDRNYHCPDKSDEVDCVDGRCLDTEWRCDSGQCIEAQLRCDREYHCHDGSDEQNCVVECKETEWQCESRLQCIDASFRCDREYHCEDGSDEMKCGVCDASQFPCDSGVCIDMSQLCDGVEDCAQAEDEIGCEPLGCSEEEFLCHTGECLAPPRVCNGHYDCPMGEDEKHCDGGATCVGDQVRCRTSEECISPEQFCDGVIDCHDESDEINCERCRATEEFACPSGQCIPIILVCDGTQDCQDGADERECPGCGDSQWQCSSGQCIDERLRCDRQYHCRDGSDEFDCEPQCQDNELKCGTGECVEKERACDGHDDCRDGTDEFNCECQSDQWRCENGQCIQLQERCDRHYHCQDGSDEYSCVAVECEAWETACELSGVCLNTTLYCDGVPHCADATDELNCPIAPPSCTEAEFKCGSGECIESELRCDRTYDCADGSDEQDCLPPSCREGEYKCGSGECIDERRRCDRQYDCADGSDEQDCSISSCREGEFKCESGECIDERRRCDRRYDCPDRSDERQCDPVTCSPGQFTCSSGQCITISQRCDGRYDCQDYSDETECRCRSGQFRCENGQCVSSTNRCNGVMDCRDGTDELDCPSPEECQPGQFRCQSGECLDISVKCNQKVDCPDSSDELSCRPPSFCQVDEFRCENGDCLDMRQRCDGRYDCTDYSDEYNCQSQRCTPHQYECQSGRCIPRARMCDGHNDCRHGDDEQQCRSTPVTVTVSPQTTRVYEGQEAVFQCRSTGNPAPLVRWTKGNQVLPSGASDVNGRLTIPAATIADAGDYMCTAVGVEGNHQATARLTVDPFGPTPKPPEGPCGREEATCKDGQCIAREFVCDGDFDCSDRSDEANCFDPLPCEPNEFQCSNGKCAQKIWKCDGDDDCGDGSDETNCPTSDPDAACRNDEYQCVAGDQCIPASYQCDGEIDCQDRSDEIGCARPTVVRPPVEEIQAQAGETVTIECEAIGVPTPLIIWRLNWGHVGRPPRVTSTSENGHGILTIRQVRDEDVGAYTCEAINNKGSLFAQPDAMLIVDAPTGVCRSPMFNSDASSAGECIECFCFGVSTECSSSNLHLTELALGGAASVNMVTKDQQRPLERNLVSTANQREFTILDYYNQVRGDYYWSLPSQFLGNKVRSYGSELGYTIFYEADSTPRFVEGADVIIHGNGIILYHQQFTSAFSDNTEFVKVKLRESEWTRVEQSRGRSSSPASRADLMMVLQNLDFILIKSNYDDYQREVRISDIRMGDAVRQETGRGRAFLVEDCVCPLGYMGPSCDECVEGYRRVESGLYLGQCVACNCHGHSDECDPLTGLCSSCQHNTEGPQCEQCKLGFYGNAKKGTPNDCLPCPCPLTDSTNQFSKECFLGQDNQVTCASCPPEYEGRRCERCAAGYAGNPMVPGDFCKPVGQGCDARGSLSSTPDSITGQCECKRYAKGPTCGSCVDNTFHLSETNPYGCIACFCMGVSTICTSTTWNRAQIGAVFTSSPQGFTLTDPDRLETYNTGLSVNSRDRVLMYRDFDPLPPGIYYWSLPQMFLGNKVSSYGGYLRYTTKYLPGFDATTNDYPDVEIAGNDIILVYRHSQATQANADQTFQVPFFEHHWQRMDGSPTNREHMLMALAKLDYILIKATYTAQTAEASIRDISMDYSEARNTGLDRAYAVEQCNCPQGYKGLSCEECDVGYRRSGGGLYLGNCEPCRCNGHSSQCDPETGFCRNCQHNTEGDHCERCAAGFYGDSTQGSPSDCKACPCPLTTSPNQFSTTCMLDRDGQVTCTSCPAGHTGRRCESCLPGYTGDPSIPGDYCRGGGDQFHCPCQTTTRPPGASCQCDQQGTVANTDCDPQTQQCQCKAHVTGRSCGECRPGYFYLSESNPQGCLACYCNGMSDQCSSSNLYWDQIRPDLTVNTHDLALTTRRLGNEIQEGFQVNPTLRQVRYYRFSDIQQDQQSLFWALPATFRGNKVESYGGKLRFQLQFSVAYDSGSMYRDVDIEIISGNERYYLLFDPPAKPEDNNKYEIVLTENSFRQLDGTNPTRETFMRALSQIDAFLIRASYHTIMADCTLRDVMLDVATPRDSGQERAYSVEKCQCPTGYAGLSCESCSPGYRQVEDPSTGQSQCMLGSDCQCNGHATCDANGRCTVCQHNTVGERCQKCAPGFYGDATYGTANDCQPCACPLTTPSNQFSQTCFLDTDGQPTCDACYDGYIGRDCGSCGPGYEGNPREIGSRCQRSSGQGAPTVSIDVRRMTQVVGASITVSVSVEGRGPFDVSWTRYDGRPLPDRATIGLDYSLTIHDLQPEDAGTYVITVVNPLGTARGEVEVEVLDSDGIKVYVEEPKSQTVTEGATVTFLCIGISQVRGNRATYTLAWTKENGEFPWDRAMDDGQGTLEIKNVRQSDAGTYTCTGSNFYSLDSDVAVLNVGVSQQKPTVHIEPRYQTVNAGDPVDFTCSATGSPTPTLEWTGGREGQLNPQSSFNNGVFHIPAARKSDEAEYFCTAFNTLGRDQIRTILFVKGDDVVEPPAEIEVVVGRPQVTGELGQTVRLECSVRGTPAQDIDIRWTRQGDQLPPGSYQDGGVLTIPRLREQYGGRYVCTITTAGLVGRGFAVLTVTTGGDSGGGGNTGGGGNNGGGGNTGGGVGTVPSVTINPERQTVGQGGTATIRCTVTGQPNPRITWSRVRDELPAHAQINNNILRIVNLKVEDRGLYVCHAENSAGQARVGAILEVERREIPQIEIYPETTQAIVTGASALFQCRVTRGIPSPTIVWSRGSGEQLTSNTEVLLESGVLRFNQVTGPEQGPYICTATNDVGSVTATATLKIQGLPRVILSPSGAQRVREGQRVVVECMAEGDPLPSVHWEYPRERPGLAAPGERDEMGQAVLDIRAVTSQDQGTYVCVADNGLGRTEGHMQIIVEGSAGGDRPTISISPPSMTAVEGQSIRLVCTAAGHPMPAIQWRRRDGSPLPADHRVQGGILEIPYMRIDYQGEYVCLARNAAGSSEDSVLLTVSAAPSVTIAPLTQGVTLGGRLVLRCEASGSQPMSFSWSKIDGEMSPYAEVRENVLEISNVRESDAGQYRCICINNAGRAEAYVSVSLTQGGGSIPTASVSPRDLSRYEGETAEFRCDSTGDPNARIEWTREGGQLPGRHEIRGGVLYLYDLRHEYEGRYICIASNALGTSRDYAYLRVIRYTGGGGGVQEQRQTVAVGDRVELTCTVSVGASVEWERVGSALPRTALVQDHVFIIPAVGADDGGTYRCVASNNIGTVYAQVALIVEAAPVFSLDEQVKSASVGSRVVLTCQAYGSPPPTITWSRQGADLPTDHEVVGGVLTIPMLREEDFGEYVCDAYNRFGSSKATVILERSELVPYFLQDPVSYMTYPTLRDAYIDFDVEMSFAPETTEGLMLYNGQMKNGEGDFMCVGMKDSAVEFKFDVGSGPAVIRSDPIQLNDWHTVRVKRHRKDGTLIVDGREYRGATDGRFQGLDLVEDMYLGGVDDFSTIARAAGYREGFVGGISRVEISGVPLSLGGEALRVVGIQDYPVCRNRPCENGGSCRAAATPRGFQCFCPDGYSGQRCEMLGERCFPGACGDRGRCFDLSGDMGYQCTCPVGRHGDRCEKGISILVPQFNYTSYVAYPTIQEAIEEVQISMMFRATDTNDAILLYNAQGSDGYGDFISITIKDGHVEFRFDSGSGAAVIRSEEILHVGEWTTLVAERNEQDGSLSINGGVAAKGHTPWRGVSPGTTVGLNLRSSLFIGGVSTDMRVSPQVEVDQGFAGCVSEVAIRGRALHLINDALDSQGIVNCQDRSPCALRPCHNSGVCEEVSTSEYICRCTSKFTGDHCEIEVNICMTDNPCENGASCEVLEDSFRCNCPLGYAGRTCNIVAEIGNQASFQGDGYIELPRELLPHTSAQATEVITMMIQTDQSDGLLFWHGQEVTTPGQGKDFLAVAIQRGKVVLSYELGSGTANITSVDRVNDGLQHEVTITRTGKHGSLQVDGASFAEGESGGILQVLNAKGNIYIGGLPDIEFMTNGKFPYSMVGCISNVNIMYKAPVDFGYEAVGGMNVEPCQ